MPHPCKLFVAMVFTDVWSGIVNLIFLNEFKYDASIYTENFANFDTNMVWLFDNILDLLSFEFVNHGRIFIHGENQLVSIRLKWY
jgi:hypothetical protein